MHAIFQHQLELMKKYHPVEVSNGYNPPELPLDINTRQGQDRIRQFAWWVTEECVESISTSDRAARGEELSDVLHFMTELCLLTGVPAPALESIKYMRSVEIYPPDTGVFDVITCLGRAINMLKMKPWKQAPKETDVDQFREMVRRAMAALINTILNNGFDPHTIYFAKHKINQERIESGY